MSINQPLEYATPTGPRIITREETETGVWFSMKPRSVWGALIGGVASLCLLACIVVAVANELTHVLKTGARGLLIIKYGVLGIALAAFGLAISRAMHFLFVRRRISPAIGIDQDMVTIITPYQSVLRHEISLSDIDGFLAVRTGFNQFQIAMDMPGRFPARHWLLAATSRRVLQPVLDELQMMLATHRPS